MVRFFFIIILLLCSCNIKFPEEQSTTEKKYREVLDADGNVKSRVIVKDGQLNGEVVTYYPGGQISAIANYVNNRKEGIEKKYYKRGSLYRTRPYENGKLHGIEIRYYKSGKVKTKQEFRYDNPATGLKEYSILGKLNTTYPKIEFEVVQERDYKEQKLLLFYISDGSKIVRYYSGKLIQNKYFDTEAEPELSREGVGELWITPNFTGSILIAAKVVRSSRGLLITQATANIKNGNLIDTEY